MTETSNAPRHLGTARLQVEFALFYCVAPLGMAVFLPPNWMFPVLFALTGLGLVLLASTPGFRWRELVEGSGRMSLWIILLVTLGTAIAGYLIIQKTRPEAFLFLLRTNPELMLMIALGYPLVSALPQELIFRPLFFRRYEAILPQKVSHAIALNALVFAFAHLMYWSWVVFAMTFVGGVLFAYSYRVRGNFPEAVVTHAIAGVIIFALGLGVYFYSGNVVRPF